MRPSQSLERQFADALIETYRVSAKLGYFSVEFDAMLRVNGGVQAAIKLVRTSEIQSGMRKLCALGRPDLTTESVMLRPEFRELFKAEYLDAAEWRLASLGVQR